MSTTSDSTEGEAMQCHVQVRDAANLTYETPETYTCLREALEARNAWWRDLAHAHPGGDPMRGRRDCRVVDDAGRTRDWDDGTTDADPRTNQIDAALADTPLIDLLDEPYRRATAGRFSDDPKANR